MLTFRWKYKKLKQTEGSWSALDIFTGQDPRLLHVQKWHPRHIETEAELSTIFQKDNMNLKHWMYFFESAFEDLSFHSFLKASDWNFEDKNGRCNKHIIWLINSLNFDRY